MFNLKTAIVVVIACSVCAAAQEIDKNSLCVNKLIQWCNNSKKSTNFYGNFMTTDFSSSGERQTVHCMAGTGGTNCTLNNSPWFACRPDGSATYKNNLLRENSSAIDDGICDAAKKARNFFTYDSAEVQAALNSGRQQYERAMRNLHNTMSNMHHVFSRPCFPFCGENNPFGRGFPFNG